MQTTLATPQESRAAKHVGEMSPGQQLIYYFEYLYRYAFAYLVFLYMRHYGIASGWLPYDVVVLILVGYVVCAAICMLLSRSQRLKLPARNGLLVLDLVGLAVGIPMDPNPGLPLLFLFYIGFLEIGLRYGVKVYLRQLGGALVALAIMIYLRASYTDIGFTVLDAWQVFLFLFIVLYGLQVFALRERAMHALQETQERLQLSLEAPGVCTWSSNSPLETLKPDGNLQHILGMVPGQFSGRMADFIAMLHPDDRDRVVADYTQFLRGDASDYDSEYRIQSLDGTLRTVNVRAKARRARDGRALSVSGMAWDLTEQRRQQESLHEMQERYRFASQAAKVGVWIWNVADGTSEIDESLGTLFDFPASATRVNAKISANAGEFLAAIHPEDRNRLANKMASLIGSDATEYYLEYRVVHKDGEVRGVHSRGTIFRDAQGKAVRIAGVTWDATQLMEARQALEQKTLDLEHTNKELDDFTYIASHDLKEPLRGISSYAQFLEEDCGDKLDDEGRRMLQRMREQARRMETLIQELLNVARLGRSRLAIEQTDLQEVVKEILVSLEFGINEKRVEIRIPQPLPQARCDRVRVGELFRNLITNGIKYNDKAQPWLEIGCNGAGPEPTFYVRDNGIGIKPEHHRQVFTMFQRLHTREAYGGGTGVGMTIAQKIVEMHGGRIWIDSELGVGTTFYFTLGRGTQA